MTVQNSQRSKEHLETAQTLVRAAKTMTDLAIAAPSMKAALAAWGSNSNLFHQGVAKEAEDPRVIAAAMARPGVVLKRAVGSTGRFVEHADLPTDLPSGSSRVLIRGDTSASDPVAGVSARMRRAAARTCCCR